MLDPIRLVTDLFKEKNLSDEHLHGFTEEFLARLANPGLNPGGLYNQLLVDCTTCYQNYYGDVKDQSLKKALLKGLTLGMNMARNNAIVKLSVLQGLIKYHFGEKSGIYKEFYPLGMRQYYHAHLGELETFLRRFKAIATMHLLGPYPAEVAELNTLIDKFISTRQAQETMFGNRAAISSDRKNHRRQLTRQLTKSFLIIASNNVEQPVKLHAFYESRYLPIRKAKKKKAEA